MGVIPQSVIDDWYSKYAGDSTLWTKYPEIGTEKAGLISELVERDRPILHQICFQNAQPVEGRKPIYVATAGAPLAGKSTVLEQEMAGNPERYRNIVKVDPDRWGMLFMANTYHGHLMAASIVANAPDFQTAQGRAYDIARPGSNFLTLEILNEAVDGNYDIAHGTTMTGEHIKDLLSGLKQKGYEIDLLLCGAEDEMRADAQQYRANVQGYYQSTPDEVISKGIAFPQKMKDYFELGDNLAVFWRDGVIDNAVKAAVYTNGQRIILDQRAYDRFVNKYKADCYALACPESGASVVLPSFSDVEQLYLSRFTRDAAPKADADGNGPKPIFQVT